MPKRRLRLCWYGAVFRGNIGLDSNRSGGKGKRDEVSRLCVHAALNRACVPATGDEQINDLCTRMRKLADRLSDGRVRVPSLVNGALGSNERHWPAGRDTLCDLSGTEGRSHSSRPRCFSCVWL